VQQEFRRIWLQHFLMMLSAQMCSEGTGRQMFAFGRSAETG